MLTFRQYIQEAKKAYPGVLVNPNKSELHSFLKKHDNSARSIIDKNSNDVWVFDNLQHTHTSIHKEYGTDSGDDNKDEDYNDNNFHLVHTDENTVHIVPSMMSKPFDKEKVLSNKHVSRMLRGFNIGEKPKDMDHEKYLDYVFDKAADKQ